MGNNTKTDARDLAGPDGQVPFWQLEMGIPGPIFLQNFGIVRFGCSSSTFA